MSEVLLPPPPPPSSPPAPPNLAPVAVLTPTPAPVAPYDPAPRPKQSPFWRTVKWPLRKLFKGLYLLGRLARQHRLVTTGIVVLLVLAIGVYGVYRATHSESPATQGAVSRSQVPDSNILMAPRPPLPLVIAHALHGFETHNAHEFFTNLSPSFQAYLASQGVGEAQLQSEFDQDRQQGLTFLQFLYTGGHLNSDGSSYYTIQVIVQQGNQLASGLFYFTVDPTGLISYYTPLSQTPPTQQP